MLCTLYDADTCTNVLLKLATHLLHIAAVRVNSLWESSCQWNVLPADATGTNSFQQTAGGCISRNFSRLSRVVCLPDAVEMLDRYSDTSSGAVHSPILQISCDRCCFIWPVCGSFARSPFLSVEFANLLLLKFTTVLCKAVDVPRHHVEHCPEYSFGALRFGPAATRLLNSRICYC